MGASAGTGVRSFAEGGSTSSSLETSAMNLGPIGESVARGLADPSSFYPQNNSPSLGGFGRINPAAIRNDPRAFGIGPAAESLRQDLAREGERNQIQNQRQIYRPQYEDYGLGSTPQAQGRLASILNMGNYGNQMPTFTRPQAPPPQAQYSIPYRTTPDSSLSGLLPKVVKSLPVGRTWSAMTKSLGLKPATPEQQTANLIKDYRGSNLTEAQYNTIMKNPAMYSDFFRRVDAGENPTTIGYAAPPPIQYMTAAQQQAYNNKVKRELDQLIAARTTFDMQDDYSGGG